MLEEKICPYPGLRPFNEEESIFFRGREEHIENIIAQLEAKKFLMLTGASGDGKSSIVYAGIIPNARAGFFKAKFNNWLIADFRPERTPLKNMAVSLNEKLGYKDVDFVERELGFGFSSLVGLYKKSPYYLDTTSADYTTQPEAEQKKLKRKAANLFILVDQFEEFFTNSENYNNGKASVKAQLVVNLLLETAKIAMAEDLPIYIVCTMRSDYVGQCAAFRGLPEFIGYSQFFVPRLKRKEMHQVIDEPAMLSGNKISNRLIETLINECDGQDQLPILQHALNRIWRAHVEDRAEEMDMIHYAKVGGFPEKNLPKEQQQPFKEWFKNQSEYKQRFLSENASLSNVLNAHAGELYEVSVDYCRKHIGKDVSREEAHEILKQIFTCLTKINDSRAVRNRATVLEIKQIVGKHVDTKLVEGLVNLFRESENTLLKPFILNGDGGSSANKTASGSLSDTDILDITHESLIRNWKDLTEWTKNDHENVSIIEDLKKQVTRWEDQNRSADYLLAIGPLSYFKGWYNNVNMNPYWLAKYDSSDLSPAQKLEKASSFIPSVKDFLKVSEARIKRSRRVAIVIAAVIGFVLIGFTSWAFIERNNALEKTKEAKDAEALAYMSEEDAIVAKNEAMVQKEKSEESERGALKAKEIAEKSKQQALIAMGQAEKSSQEAKQSALIAKNETQKANEALTESEKAKREAIQSKEIAEKAQKVADRISNISLAQSVALKSELFRKDPQVQGLLAYQAYRFIVDNNGNTQDPIVYSAIRNAYLNLNRDSVNSQMKTVNEQRAAIFENNETLLTADKQGQLNKWDVKSGKVSIDGELPFRIQCEAIAFTEWQNILVSGHKDGRVMFWNISKVESPVLIKDTVAHKMELRAIGSNKKKNLIATSGKDSCVVIWKNNGATITQMRRVKVKSAVRELLILPDGNDILLIFENGLLETLDVGTGIVTQSVSKFGKAWSMKLSDNGELLAVGYTDGAVQLFDPAKIIASGALIHTFSQNNSTLEKLAFDKQSQLLAVATSDKSIRVFNLAKKEQKPIEVKDLKGKSRDLVFDKDGIIYSLGSDHHIRRIEPSTEKVASVFCNLLTRNLTQLEWNQNVSETMPYEKTCKNK